MTTTTRFGILRTLALLVALAAATLTAAATAAPVGTLLYGIDDSGDLYEIDPVAQTSTLTKSGAASSAVNAAAYDASRDQLFFIDTDQNLNYWDKQSDAVTSLGNALSLTSNPANAAYYDNAYWYFDTNSTQLNRADLTYTGSTPSVGSITPFSVSMSSTGDNTNTFGDIAIDTATGTLYASTSRGRFYSLDLSSPTNSFTEIAASLGSDRSVGLQLSFNDSNSTLYGHRYTDGSWYTIDTATGAATAISGFVTLPDGSGFRDLGGAAPVPEPSTFALAGMAVLGGLGELARRRRKATSAA